MYIAHNKPKQTIESVVLSCLVRLSVCLLFLYLSIQYIGSRSVYVYIYFCFISFVPVGSSLSVCLSIGFYVCASVCVKERKRDRKRERQTDTEREKERGRSLAVLSRLNSTPLEARAANRSVQFSSLQFNCVCVLCLFCKLCKLSRSRSV